MVAIVAALAVNQIFYPQSATVNGARAYLGDEVWVNGTNIPWGYIDAGKSYDKNFTVFNAGNSPINVSLIVAPPVNWTETWAGNMTLNLAPSSAVTGNLTLTVPIDAIPGDYTWPSWLNV